MNLRVRIRRRRGDRSEDDRPLPTQKHRDDLQGLRAVAVLLVLLDHARIGAFSGGYVGVDVFFVLSGFLITGLLLSGVEKSGRVRFSDFYTRRSRRILPAAVLTLVAVDVVAYQIVNFVRAKPIMWDSIWAGFFSANIRFAHAGTDYFARAQGQGPSPLLHFWSLAVEEQFYLVWPTVIAIVLFGTALVRRRRGGAAEGLTERRLSRLLVAIAVISLASLAWSVYATETNPRAAYFSTFTRAWELGLGAGLAIALASLRRLSPTVSSAVGWLGMAAIVTAGLVFSGSTAFPGYAALLPTVGAALVIAAGSGARQPRFGVGRLLGQVPFRYVGDRSYSLYLWHWPALVLGGLYLGHLSVVARLLLLLGAFLLSIVTYGVYENPIRHMKSKPLGLLLWPVSVGAVVLVAGLTLNSIAGKVHRFEARGTAAKPVQLAAQHLSGSAARGHANGVLPVVVRTVKKALQGAGIPAHLKPAIDELPSDHYVYPSGCEAYHGQTKSTVCKLGDLTSKRSIVVLGDSHMQVWMPAILKMAKRDGWLVRPIGKSGCTPPHWIRKDLGSECTKWFDWALKQIALIRPSVTVIGGVFVPLNGSMFRGGDGGRATAKAISVATRRIEPVSKHVVVMGDVPYLKEDPVNCLVSQGATLRRCSTKPTRPRLYRYIAASTSFAGAGFMDTRKWFCYRGLCPMVIGRTIAYIDRGHVSKTYALQLARPFRKAFGRAIQQK